MGHAVVVEVVCEAFPVEPTFKDVSLAFFRPQFCLANRCAGIASH